MDDEMARAARGAVDGQAARGRNVGRDFCLRAEPPRRGPRGRSPRRLRSPRGPIRGRGARIRLRGPAMSALAVVMTALGCGGDAEIEKPTPLFTRSPVEYPLELWDRDVEGNTLVRVLVNEEGGVDSAMVMESSGHPELDSAAVHGALSMEFDPATREGEPLRVWARVPVHFSKDARPAGSGRRGDPAGEPREGSPANPNVTSGFRE